MMTMTQWRDTLRTKAENLIAANGNPLAIVAGAACFLASVFADDQIDRQYFRDRDRAERDQERIRNATEKAGS